MMSTCNNQGGKRGRLKCNRKTLVHYKEEDSSQMMWVEFIVYRFVTQTNYFSFSDQWWVKKNIKTKLIMWWGSYLNKIKNKTVLNWEELFTQHQGNNSSLRLQKYCWRSSGWYFQPEVYTHPLCRPRGRFWFSYLQGIHSCDFSKRNSTNLWLLEEIQYNPVTSPRDRIQWLLHEIQSCGFSKRYNPVTFPRDTILWLFPRDTNLWHLQEIQNWLL